MRDFGIEHAADFAPTSLATQLFATMSGIVDAIEAHAAAEFAKDTGAKQGTTGRTEAREELRDALNAVRRTARPLARRIPGIDDKFSVPASYRDQDLLSAALASAGAAEPMAGEFIARELPADFLADLRTKIETLEAAISDQSENIGQRVAARAAIDMNVAKGIETVADLDPIVKNRYANQPDILAQWTSVKHTERDPQNRSTSGVTTGSTTGNSPSTSTSTSTSSSPSTSSTSSTSTPSGTSSVSSGTAALPAAPGSSASPTASGSFSAQVSAAPGASGGSTPAA